MWGSDPARVGQRVGQSVWEQVSDADQEAVLAAWRAKHERRRPVRKARRRSSNDETPPTRRSK